MIRRSVFLALGLMACLGFFACTAEEETPGQLVLTLQTDMSLPEDVDEVEIEISSFGSVQFANTYAVGAEGLRIPATLSILAGRDPSKPVTIRVLAMQEGNARTLREVVTTVPADRLATLRMPIQWLCDDMVETEGETAKSSCPSGQTCVAGSCVDKDVDSSALPDYRAEDVFGGGDGPDSGGKCFDTVACFAEGAATQVDMSDCSLALPESEGEGVNVAIVTEPGKGGICGSQACLVPLDANSDAGWQEEEGRINLPDAVCQRLEDGRALAVAVTTACEQKTESIPTCGPWSSVSSSEGTRDGKAPDGVLDGGTDEPSETVEDSGGGMVSALIGPEGGTLTSGDGVLTVDVPPEAVEQEFTLTIAPTVDVPGGSVAPVYDVGPDGQQFLSPVQVTYAYGNLDGAFEITDSLQLASFDSKSEDPGWMPLTGSMLDRDGQTVTGTTGHFTLFGLIDGGQCVPTEKVGEQAPTTLYLMIDGSSAMVETSPDGGDLTLWDEMRDGLTQFLNDPASADTPVAVRVYNDTASGVCSGASFSLPDVAVDLAPTIAPDVQRLFTSEPVGSPTLEGPLNGIVGFAENLTSTGNAGAVAGVLYSAGAPSGLCETSGTALASIVTDSRFPVFTMWGGSNEPLVLEEIGAASGTGFPFAANTAADIAAGLASIRDETISCVFKKDPAIDPSLLQVSVEGADGGRTTLSRVETPELCAEAPNGWVELAPDFVGLCPAACEPFTGGGGGRVIYEAGCPSDSGSGTGTGGSADGGASIAPEFTFDTCLEVFGGTECISCACNTCLTTMEACYVEGPGCPELLQCIDRTGCIDFTACNQADTCASEVTAAGGPEGTGTMLAMDVLACAGDACSGVCGQPAPTTDAGTDSSSSDSGSSGGGVSTDSGTGDPCPSTMPESGTECTTEGQTCDYDTNGSCGCSTDLLWQCIAQ